MYLKIYIYVIHICKLIHEYVYAILLLYLNKNNNNVGKKEKKYLTYTTSNNKNFFLIKNTGIVTNNMLRIYFRDSK